MPDNDKKYFHLIYQHNIMKLHSDRINQNVALFFAVNIICVFIYIYHVWSYWMWSEMHTQFSFFFTFIWFCYWFVLFTFLTSYPPSHHHLGNWRWSAKHSIMHCISLTKAISNHLFHCPTFLFLFLVFIHFSSVYCSLSCSSPASLERQAVAKTKAGHTLIAFI